MIFDEHRSGGRERARGCGWWKCTSGLDQYAKQDPEGAREAAGRLAILDQVARDTASRKDNTPNRIRAIPIPHGALVVPGFTAVAQNTTTVPFPLTFPISGLAIGIAVSAKGTGLTTNDTFVNAMTGLGLRVTLAGAVQGELFSDGQGGNFMSFYSLSTQWMPVFPLSRRFSRNEVWQFTIQNNLTGLNNVTPVVQILYLDDSITGN